MLADLEEVVKIQDFVSIPNIIDENVFCLKGMELRRPRFKFPVPKLETWNAVFYTTLEILGWQRRVILFQNE